MKRGLNLNEGNTIKTVKNEMIAMQQQGGNRDWSGWKALKKGLATAYNDEE